MLTRFYASIVSFPIEKEFNGMHDHRHGRFLRIGRSSQPGNVYLITCVVKDREPVFTRFQLGRLLVREIRRLHDSGAVHSMAWVVMPDHLHWLFELRSGSLSKVMQSLKGCSSYEINKAYGANTLVWQKGYYDKAVRAERDLAGMARYVIANPIRARLVESIGDYPLWDCVWT